jgi:hypothetical protein
MNPSNIAILISLISASVAGLSLGWNIYRDIILKPKVLIKVYIGAVISNVLNNNTTYVVISATNFGPGTTTLSMIHVKKTSPWRWLYKKTHHAIIIHDYTNPLSGQLPCKLNVGEKVDLLLRYDKDCFFRKPWSHVGVYDIFGKTHWAKKYQVINARKTWLKDFRK